MLVKQSGTNLHALSSLCLYILETIDDASSRPLPTKGVSSHFTGGN